MVRSAVAQDRLSSYFPNLAKQNKYSTGLILGQSVGNKDFIIHFANIPTLCLKTIAEINEELVANHAQEASWMLPGGMHILGLFFVSPEDMLSVATPKIRSILTRLHKNLESQEYLYGNVTNEKLVLNYCANRQQFVCKSFEVTTGSVKAAELKFVPGLIRWVEITCKYQMEQVYNIEPSEREWPLKKHMGIILDLVSDNLQSSVFLYDGELRDTDESIESVGKKKIPRSNKSGNQEESSKPVQVCILQPCRDDKDNFQIGDFDSEIKITGQVVSKLWVNPKFSIQEASEAVRQDIMRSLSARLKMHWDSLTEEEHGEEFSSVHEPPRRVLIPLPNSSVAISNYLFPGEGPNDARLSLEEVLDIKINETDVLNVEGQANLNEYYSDTGESESEDLISHKSADNNKTLYFIGLGVTLLVLIVSLLIHFIQS